jgi:hypothetical protein
MASFVKARDRRFRFTRGADEQERVARGNGKGERRGAELAADGRSQLAVRLEAHERRGQPDGGDQQASSARAGGGARATTSRSALRYTDRVRAGGHGRGDRRSGDEIV